MKALLVVVGLLVTAAVVLVAQYVSAYNYGNQAEQGLEAQYKVNQNTLAQYVQKVQEAAQVPAQYSADLTKLMTDVMGGRYGAEGSKATWQWIKEQNPSLDPKLYEKIQQIVEAGRDEFKVNQNKLTDLQRQYQTNLGYLVRGMFLRIAGYPKVDLKKYDPITNDYTQDAYKKGKETGPVTIFPKK